MGSFRGKGYEGVKEIQKEGRETTETGSEMTEQADEINAVLESINLQDSEDIQAIRDTGDSYQESFDTAFSEQVEQAGDEIREQGRQLGDTMGAELENVRSGISSLEQAEGISEIGREAAEAGSRKLEGSAGEYEGIIADTERTVDDVQAQIEALKNNLDGLFG